MIKDGDLGSTAWATAITLERSLTICTLGKNASN
jgi:hypothetical protein